MLSTGGQGEVSKKIYTECLKAAVTKNWCLEQSCIFQFLVKGVQGLMKLADLCGKTVSKVWSGSSECSMSRMQTSAQDMMYCRMTNYELLR